MGVTLFEPPAFPIDEPQRDHCVEASGALLARNDPYLQSLVETARTRMHTAMAAISIVYRDWQYLIAASGIPAGVYSRRTSLCGHAILRPTELLYIPDATRDARFADNPIVGEDKTLRFYLAAPLVDSHGFALGTLCVFDPQPRADIARADAVKLATLAHAVVERLVTLNDVAVRDAPPTVALRPGA